MNVVNRIILTLHVPSIEKTAAWYERVLGWQGHFDTFDDEGHALFGSVMLQAKPFVGLNLAQSARDGAGEAPETCDHGSIWIYVEDVDAIYRRVMDEGWPIETPIADQFWGERLFKMRDLNGNQLVLVQQIEEIGLEEIRERHRTLSQA